MDGIYGHWGSEFSSLIIRKWDTGMGRMQVGTRESKVKFEQREKRDFILELKEVTVTLFRA